MFTSLVSVPCEVQKECTDPSPFMDIGSLWSVGRINSAAALSVVMGITIDVQNLAGEPLYQVFGPDCNGSKVLFATWKLPLKSMKDKEVVFKFYLTTDDDRLLLGNGVTSNSNLLGSENTLRTPPTVVVSKKNVKFRTYILVEENNRRTHFLAVPRVSKSFTSFLCSQSSPHSSNLQ